MHLVKPVDMIALLHALDEALGVVIVAGSDAGPSVLRRPHRRESAAIASSAPSFTSGVVQNANEPSVKPRSATLPSDLLTISQKPMSSSSLRQFAALGSDFFADNVGEPDC